MQVTVQIKAELAQSLKSKQTSTGESKLLSDLLRSMNLELHAMHPGVVQAGMSKMFYVKTVEQTETVADGKIELNLSGKITINVRSADVTINVTDSSSKPANQNSESHG